MQKLKEKFKQTEVGLIPEDWEVLKIADLCTVRGGKRLPKGVKFSSYKTNHPYLRIVDFTSSGLNKDNLEYINDDIFKLIRNYIIEVGDIYLSIVGSVGLVGLIDEEVDKANLTENAVRLTCNNKLDNRFLLYFLRSQSGQDQILAHTVGAVQPKLPLYGIKNIDIPIPPLSEQQKIAEILGSLDEKIELNRKMNKVIESIGQAIFKRWFVNLGGVTENIQKLADLNPIESLPKGFVARYLEMKDLSETGMWCSSQIRKKYMGGTKFQNGDSLLARITPCLENGKSAYVNFLDDDEIAFGSTEYIIFRPKKEIYKEFIYFLIRDERFREYAIRSMVGSSGRQRVQIDSIKQYSIDRADEEVFKRFHDLMQPIFTKIKTNCLEIGALSQIRDSLLPRLMSGRLRVR